MTKVTAIVCGECKNLVYSRAGHDYRSCSCKAVAIDGGRNYTKITFSKDKIHLFVDVQVPHTDREIYADWNKRLDKLGRLDNYLASTKKIILDADVRAGIALRLCTKKLFSEFHKEVMARTEPLILDSNIYRMSTVPRGLSNSVNISSDFSLSFFHRPTNETEQTYTIYHR